MDEGVASKRLSPYAYVCKASRDTFVTISQRAQGGQVVLLMVRSGCALWVIDFGAFVCGLWVVGCGLSVVRCGLCVVVVCC